MRTLGPIVLVGCGLATIGCGARNHRDTIALQGQQMRVELAQTYVDKGAKQAAIPLLRRAVAEQPRDEHVRVLYGSVLRDLGLYPQAERQLRYALTLRAGYAPAQAALGILYDLQGQSARALTYHRRAVSSTPSHAGYRNNYGFSLLLAGRVDEAIVQLEKALALDPSLAAAYNNLGFAYGRRGQLEEAKRAFRTVGTAPEAMLNMSVVYEERGDGARADELRAQAYAMAPDLRPDDTEENR